jgi:hypothetical protein
MVCRHPQLQPYKTLNPPWYSTHSTPNWPSKLLIPAWTLTPKGMNIGGRSSIALSIAVKHAQRVHPESRNILFSDHQSLKGRLV